MAEWDEQGRDDERTKPADRKPKNFESVIGPWPIPSPRYHDQDLACALPTGRAVDDFLTQYAKPLRAPYATARTLLGNQVSTGVVRRRYQHHCQVGRAKDP